MANTTWETPQYFYDKLNKEFNFTLDPCAEDHTAKCFRYFTKEDDGLKQNWSKEIVFMNPPYDHNIDKWMRKAYNSAQKGATIVCLIQGRSSDTIWWHDTVMKASEIRYIKGRVYFGLNGVYKRRPTFSSIIIIFRPYCMGPPCVKSTKAKN